MHKIVAIHNLGVVNIEFEGEAMQTDSVFDPKIQEFVFVFFAKSGGFDVMFRKYETNDVVKYIDFIVDDIEFVRIKKTKIISLTGKTLMISTHQNNVEHYWLKEASLNELVGRLKEQLNIESK